MSICYLRNGHSKTTGELLKRSKTVISSGSRNTEKLTAGRFSAGIKGHLSFPRFFEGIYAGTRDYLLFFADESYR